MLDFVVTGIGISGVIFIASMFYLEITNKVSKDHKTFTYLNFLGNFCLFFYSFYFQVWLFVLLNGFLLLESLYGMYFVHKKKR
jgi:lipid-A-disaccharide synthase-like uncharacterized protein